MYYINFIFVYSFLGFVLESTYFKIHNANLHSGIFLGPYTFVYGIGMFASFFVYKLINIPNNLLSFFIYYIIFGSLTSLIEFICGHLIYYFLHIDKWNYEHYKYHFGKYLCLNNSLIWGILVYVCIFYIHPFLNSNIIKTLPKRFTIFILIIFIIDLIILINKSIKINFLKTKK